MIRVLTRLHGLPAALVVCTYAAAVLTLTWLTQDGQVSDGLYGSLCMLLLAFPLSLVGDSVYDAIIGQRHDDLAYGWEYVEMGWPGITTALVLVLLLMWRRTRLAGQVVGWALTAAVLLPGVAIVSDQRRWQWEAARQEAAGTGDAKGWEAAGPEAVRTGGGRTGSGWVPLRGRPLRRTGQPPARWRRSRRAISSAESRSAPAAMSSATWSGSPVPGMASTFGP